MAYPNIVDNYSAAIQAEMRKSVMRLRQQVAPTKTSFKSGAGARGEAGRLAGLEIPYYQNVPHGSTALDVISGTTSFERFVAPVARKMYVGLTQMGYSVEFEHYHEQDAQKGFLPETRYTMRDKVMQTYMQEQNWYAIGDGSGALGVVTAYSSPTLTFANDNTARGRSKGSLRLAISPATATKIVYQTVNPATDTVTATFYITAKSSATTATITITDGGTPASGNIVVKKGHYKKVPYGLGYHIVETPRQYQGANTAVDTFLNSRRVNGGGAALTPTIIDTAKGALQIRANDTDARNKRVCHMTIGHYKTLAAFGYTLRQYNAEQGKAKTSYGLPYIYEDEDTMFFQDADMEDAYVYMRDRVSYFEYRQMEMTEITKGATQYIGTNSFGSTEFYQNFGEAFNLAWDGRGDDGKSGTSGAPNSSVVIDNLQIPALNQVAEGLSLV